MYQKAILENGLRVVTSPMLHTRSVCVSTFVGAGSRYEAPEEAGVSHFIEHLLFKGTERRPSARDISEAIEGVGGILNGGTDKELTLYWAKVARPHYPLALDLLVDMLRASRLDPQEMEKERRVIIEELNMAMDSPQQRVDMLIDELRWPDQALGRDVAGSKETVAALSRQMLLDYLGHQYLPAGTVISVAGDIAHEEVVDSVGRAFADWSGGVAGPWYPADDSQEEPRIKVERRKTEQAHLCLAVHGCSHLDNDRYTLDLLNILLGEGMSSRLFLELREKRGMAYDVHSYGCHLYDSGALVIYAGVPPRHISACIEVILSELERLKTEAVAEAELAKAREFGKGRLLLSMEDTRSVARWTGSQELLTGSIRSVDDVVGIVDTITPEDIQRVSQRLFIADKLSLAVVGPVRDGDKLYGLLKL